MISKAYARIKQWEREWKSSFGADISTPEARRDARLHNNLVDHAFLRRILPNRYQVSEDVWRSNQPDPVHFPALQAAGIKTIINLRGDSPFSFYLFEKEACADYGITLHDHQLFARELLDASAYLTLLELIETAPKPLLFHCKSGADRTGLAAALYLLDQQGADVETAQKQLSLKYAHQHWSKAGILDHMIDAYGQHIATDPISVRDWLANHYDAGALTASFHARRGKT